MVHGVNTKGVPSSRTESAKRQMIRKKKEKSHHGIYENTIRRKTDTTNHASVYVYMQSV